MITFQENARETALKTFVRTYDIQRKWFSKIEEEKRDIRKERHKKRQ